MSTVSTLNHFTTAEYFIEICAIIYLSYPPLVNYLGQFQAFAAITHAIMTILVHLSLCMWVSIFAE